MPQKPPQTPTHQTDFTNTALIEPKPIKWLWPGRIPLGHITLISGHPGVGKSTVAADITARTTTTHDWPDSKHPLIPVTPALTDINGFELRPAQAIYLSAQDSLSAVIRPRLEACGADLERIIVASITPHPEDLIDQLHIFANHLYACFLIVIDPLSTYLRHFETSRGRDAVTFLESLAELAAVYNLAILGITHQTRSQRGPDIARLTSSVSLTAASRAVWTIRLHPHEPERRLFMPAKNNFAPATSGLAFRIGPAADNPQIGHAVWDETAVSVSEVETLRPRQPLNEEATEVDCWLLQQLANGPVPTPLLRQRATRDGFAWITLKRAKNRLGIRAKTLPENSTNLEKWHWFLPQTPGISSPHTQKTDDVHHDPSDVAPAVSTRALA